MAFSAAARRWMVWEGLTHARAFSAAAWPLARRWMVWEGLTHARAFSAGWSGAALDGLARRLLRGLGGAGWSGRG